MKYVGFGDSSDTKIMLPEFINALAYIVDNDPDKHGNFLGNTEITSVERLASELEDVFVIVLSEYHYSEIALQLRLDLGLIEGKNFVPSYNWYGNDDIIAPYPNSTWHEYQHMTDYYAESWDTRKKIMASMLDFSEIHSIADLGCGEQGLRKYLPETIRYFPVDYIKRDHHTIIADFNNYEFPDFVALHMGRRGM